jgi:hypothetical protein
LGAVFAVNSSNAKTREVASALEAADWAEQLMAAHAKKHAVRASVFIDGLS